MLPLPPSPPSPPPAPKIPPIFRSTRFEFRHLEAPPLPQQPNCDPGLDLRRYALARHMARVRTRPVPWSGRVRRQRKRAALEAVREEEEEERKKGGGKGEEGKEMAEGKGEEGNEMGEGKGEGECEGEGGKERGKEAKEGKAEVKVVEGEGEGLSGGAMDVVKGEELVQEAAKEEEKVEKEEEGAEEDWTVVKMEVDEKEENGDLKGQPAAEEIPEIPIGMREEPRRESAWVRAARDAEEFLQGLDWVLEKYADRNQGKGLGWMCGMADRGEVC